MVQVNMMQVAVRQVNGKLIGYKSMMKLMRSQCEQNFQINERQVNTNFIMRQANRS